MERTYVRTDKIEIECFDSMKQGDFFMFHGELFLMITDEKFICITDTKITAEETNVTPQDIVSKVKAFSCARI